MLKEIGELLPMLDVALVPETASDRVRHAPPTEDQVAAFRAERLERHLLKTKYLPEEEAPADLAVIQAIKDAERYLCLGFFRGQQAAGLPQRCRRCNHLYHEHAGGNQCGLCSPCPGFGLTGVPPGDKRWEALLGNSLQVAEAAEPAISSALKAARAALATDDTYLLMSPCPWCGGRTKSMPSGSLTLRVHVSPQDAGGTFAVCENPDCPVPEEHCGTRHHGRPAWPYHELDWLNDRIDDMAG